jgi:IS5 family transposase
VILMTTRRRGGQLTLDDMVMFGSAMPKPSELMDPELRRIDLVVDDDQIVDHVVEVLRKRWPNSAGHGRSSTPAEIVLRLLVLKHLRRWSYEQLEWEVTGNLVYRHFCRIQLGKVPDAKTMVRYGQLLDEDALRPIFERIVHQAKEDGVTRGRRMRVDTTVVEAPIHHPTDSDLCADVVRVVGRELERIEEAGAKLPFRRADVRRSVGRRLREIAQGLRRRGEAAKRAVKRPYRRLLRVTGRLVRQAEMAAQTLRQRLPRMASSRRRRVERSIAKLERVLPQAQQVVRQTRARILRGITNSDGKIVSIFEPYAQILRRGKLHRPTEFGALIKVQEAEGGIVTEVGVVAGKSDAGLLVASVERHIEIFGRAPHLAATDRGFFSNDGERRIVELGVKRPVIPHSGHRSQKRIAHERQRWFRRGRAWRAGGEARISRLKNTFGMARSRYRGLGGMKRTVYWAAIANNLVAIGRAA